MANHELYVRLREGDFTDLRAEGRCLTCFVADNKVVTEPCVNPSSRASFETWARDAVSPDHRMSSASLRKAYTRLAAPKKRQRKNADLREFLTSKNYFMVKKYFTLGLQTTVTEHVIVTLHKPLNLYTYDNRFLQAASIPCDEPSVLDTIQPFTERRIPPGTKYLLLALSKCVFFWNVEPCQPRLDDVEEFLRAQPD